VSFEQVGREGQIARLIGLVRRLPGCEVGFAGGTLGLGEY
jgi:hypothetical protein